MNLLTMSGELYRELRNQRKPHDPAVLRFRQWMTEQFMEAGMKVAQAVDDEISRPQRPAEESEPAFAKGYDPQNDKFARKRNLKVFHHPLQGQPLTAPGREAGKIKGRLPQNTPDTLQGEESTTDLSTITENQKERAVVAEKQPAKSVDDVAKNRLEQLEAAGETLQKETAKALTDAELKEIPEMSLSAVAKKFDRAQLEAFLNHHGLPYRADASDRQIAGVVLSFLKESK